jgi:hypothetical protein
MSKMKKVFVFFFVFLFSVSVFAEAKEKPSSTTDYDNTLAQLEVGFGVYENRLVLPFSIGARQRIAGMFSFEQMLNVGIVFNSQEERDEYVESNISSEYWWDSSVDRCRASNGQFTESSNCDNNPPLNVSVYGTSELQYSLHTGSDRHGSWFLTFGTGVAYGKVFGEIVDTTVLGSSFTLRMDQFSHNENRILAVDHGFFFRSVIPYQNGNFQSFVIGSSFLF